MNKLAAIKDLAMGKRYELSLVKTYVSRWGMVQAIRELIQNALDSESPFVYEFASESLEWTLYLNSEYTTLTPKTLLLGATSKEGSETAIGSFGEGYKIAMLVLTREGYDVTLLNGEKVWKPRFVMSRAFGEEVLCVEESHADQKGNKGLTFIVKGLTAEDVDAIRASCLKMQDHVGAIKATQYGDILLEQPGMLYVGSLFICRTEMKYGYNIKPKYLRLERDRETVSSWDLKEIAIKLWYETKEFDRVATMISEELPDVEYARWNAPELVKEECYKIFRKNNPGAIIAESVDDMKKKIEAGMMETVYVGGGMYYAVSQSTSYRNEPKNFVAVVAPHVSMASFLSAHRDEMRRPAIVAFKSLIAEAEKKWVLK